MPGKRFSAQHIGSLVWICRRLAEALQEGASLGPALEKIAQRAPESVRPLLSAIRRRVSSGERMSEELMAQGAPSYVWGAVYAGEITGSVGPALLVLADRLEIERTLEIPPNYRLGGYALAFGRLGMLLRLGVPVIQALETAAESVAPSEAADALTAARREIIQGDSLSDALARAAPGLPALTIEMIRDGENDRRLHEALSVVADYLLDEAARKPAQRGKKKEVRNA